ncbi:MAG: glycosyltransferase family 4 protein [Patescibacteria group bacterium]|jgi:glycosyltransferase involved in cell wall biosynthesis
MKIAMIGQKGMPAIYGGVERHVEELSLELVKRGHDVTVYTRRYYTAASRKNYRGIKLVSLPTLHTKHFDAITHTFLSTWHAMWHGYDVIHYHSVGPSLLSFLPRLFSPRTKVIATFHSMDRLHQKWGIFARTMLRLGEIASLYFPHQTIVVSRQLRDYCRRTYGRQTTYIPNGVSHEFTRPVAADIIKRKYGLRKGGYILTVSRIIPPKGLHHLISAYRQLNTDKRLVIVGGSVHTDRYLQQLHDQAKQDRRILFTGFQNGRILAELYSNAYLYVLPSEIEGMPLSLLEAAGFGRCTVVSNIPANVAVLRSHGHDFGIMFRNKNSKDLARKLDMLLERPALTRSLGQLARELVRAKFNWRHIATDTERIYSAV